MCAQYEVKGDLIELLLRLNESLPLHPADLKNVRQKSSPSAIRVAPGTLAPVIAGYVGKPGPARVGELRFSLVPAWSLTETSAKAGASRPKFATYNARLEGISTKPTWREPFARRHCLVPMSGFIEPIYASPAFPGLENSMVSFRSPDFVMAAGIWEEATRSFAIITDSPIPFVEKVGHDRSPLFLRPSAWAEWLFGPPTPEAATAFLRANREDPSLAPIVDRPLKSRGGAENLEPEFDFLPRG
ncbi:MAG: SOS response-associated peptidase family protein [Bacteriovoracia bacterium]